MVRSCEEGLVLNRHKNRGVHGEDHRNDLQVQWNFTQLNLNRNHTLKKHFRKLQSSYRHLERHSVYPGKKKISHFWATIKSYFRLIFRPGRSVHFNVPCVALYNILLISLMPQHKPNNPHTNHTIKCKRAGLFLHDPAVCFFNLVTKHTFTQSISSGLFGSIIKNVCIHLFTLTQCLRVC